MVLLGPSEEVKIVLKEALSTTITEASNEIELDGILQEVISENNKFELAHVVSPLLSTKEPESEENDKEK